MQLHRILYIAHMVHAGRNDGACLVSDEPFHARNLGPILPSVAKRVEAFGVRPIRNVFNSVPGVPEGQETEVIQEALARLAHTPAAKLIEIVLGAGGAWSRSYHEKASLRIPQADILAEYRVRFPDLAPRRLPASATP